ncbi:MAG: redoxin domain-containing protein, partial [Vicinamibacteria bacterium]
FPILSDWKRDAAKAYGLYDENGGVARRATFVVDKAGVVRTVDVGREALDPSGVVGMCKTLETH